MTDQRLRELERAAAAGDPAAEAALLVERLRAGEVRPDVVRVRALLGDPAARAALGCPEVRDAREVAALLATLDPRHLGVGLAAVARLALGDDRSNALARATGLLLERFDAWLRAGAAPSARGPVEQSLLAVRAFVRHHHPPATVALSAVLLANRLLTGEEVAQPAELRLLVPELLAAGLRLQDLVTEVGRVVLPLVGPVTDPPPPYEV